MQGMGQQQGITGKEAQQPDDGDSHLQPVTIEDIFQDDVVTAEPDTPIATIAAQMSEEDVGAVVIEDDSEPVGIITDRSIAMAIQETPDLSEQTAEDLMTGEIVTGTDEMTVLEALQKLNDESIRRLPVVDADDKLVGIVTLDDIIVLLGSELQDTAEIIQAQSSRL